MARENGVQRVGVEGLKREVQRGRDLNDKRNFNAKLEKCCKTLFYFFVYGKDISKRTKSENENVSRNVKKNTNSPVAGAYCCGDSYTGIGHVVRQYDNARIFGGSVLKKASITQRQMEICFALLRLRLQLKNRQSSVIYLQKSALIQPRKTEKDRERPRKTEKTESILGLFGVLLQTHAPGNIKLNICRILLIFKILQKC